MKLIHHFTMCISSLFLCAAARGASSSFGLNRTATTATCSKKQTFPFFAVNLEIYQSEILLGKVSNERVKAKVRLLVGSLKGVPQGHPVYPSHALQLSTSKVHLP